MIIAIDGHSSCGKSTIAKALAKKLGIAYVDTGAMYRAITLYFLQHKIPLSDQANINSALSEINITIKNEDGKNEIYLNGQNVSNQIRTPEVNNMVSPVSAIPAVRQKLVAMQRAMGSSSLVMDGRDIGSVVFPDADIKFFVTADLQTRAKRRLDELISFGYNNVTFEEIVENLDSRDKTDSSRAVSPLIQLPDAILIDTTLLTLEDQLDLVLNHVKRKLCL
jgi:cytidylate kinase